MKYIVFVVSMMGAAYMILFSGFRLPTPVALVSLICAVSADFLTTYLCLREQRKEGNPVIAFLFAKIGIGGTFGLLACIWVVFILFRWLPSTHGIQTAIACVYWAVPVNNLIVLRKVKEANRKNHVAQNSTAQNG